MAEVHIGMGVTAPSTVQYGSRRVDLSVTVSQEDTKSSVKVVKNLAGELIRSYWKDESGRLLLDLEKFLQKYSS